MAIYKPTELHPFLQELGIHPKKVLSQNFLIDGNIVRKILLSAEVTQGDLVLEIGPGPGSLTEELLAQGANVIAVEKDDVLANALQRLSKGPGELHVSCGDIMEFPLDVTLKSFLKPGQKAKVIGNLPYHLTTAIIEKFIGMHDLISSLTFMVQDEVARRFTALPYTKAYGSITLFLNFYSSVNYAFSVSNHCFFPIPKVNSAIVTFTLNPPQKVSDVDAFFQLTRTAFQQRRKMMRSSLKELYAPENIMNALRNINCSSLARPEELSLPQFINFFETLQNILL